MMSIYTSQSEDLQAFIISLKSMLHMENASLQSTTISITIFLDHLIPYVIVNFPEPIYPIRLGSNVSTTRVLYKFDFSDFLTCSHFLVATTLTIFSHRIIHVQ